MFSSQGLENWEFLFVSGMLAVGMLVISSLIGWTVAYLVLREPGITASTVAQTDSVSAAAIPQCAEGVAIPAYAGKRRRLAVSSR
jgi:hypothetical protein